MSTRSNVSPPANSGKRLRELPKQPAQQFWQRYSPHHEFPLSGISSIALHLGIGGLVIAGAFWMGQARAKDEMPLPFGTVQVGNSVDGESGTEETAKGEQVAEPLPPSPSLLGKDKPLPPLPMDPIPPLVVPITKNIDFDSFLKENEAARQKIKEMPQLERSLLDGLVNGRGVKDGTGQEGKEGTKGGPEKGDPKGSRGIINERAKRQLRWTMNFSTYDGNDYLKQLEDLGAKLAIPLKSQGQKYLLINDLTRPSKTETVEDLGKLGLISWTDDSKNSIEGLTKTLKIKEKPTKVIAFFPLELEERLAKMELAYAERNGHKTVDEIGETVFQVKGVKSKYQPVVLDQRYKQP